MPPWEGFGMKSVVSGAGKKWRTLSTLFYIAHTGTKNEGKLACRLTPLLLQRVSGCMGCFPLLGL
eukprot:5803849-Amphidinium_carterae.1